MTMEMNKVLGTIIVVALASAGILDILLILIIDKLGGVIDSLNSIGVNLHIIHNDAHDVAKMLEDGVYIETEELDELE